MYKITLYDENCSPICDGVTYFFTEDLDDFEKNWRPRVREEKWERYERSKAGEIVTDYYGNDPAQNIVQEDKCAELLFEKEVVFHNKLFILLNAYGWESEVYAAETSIVFRGIKFNGDCFLIGKYKMAGVCERDMFSEDEEAFASVGIWGNPVINCRLQEKEMVQFTKEGRVRITYTKADFKDDSLETYCWVTIGKYSEEELTSGTINLESDEMMVYLFRDIPGEAG